MISRLHGQDGYTCCGRFPKWILHEQLWWVGSQGIEGQKRSKLRNSQYNQSSLHYRRVQHRVQIIQHTSVVSDRLPALGRSSSLLPNVLRYRAMDVRRAKSTTSIRKTRRAVLHSPCVDILRYSVFERNVCEHCERIKQSRRKRQTTKRGEQRCLRPPIILC